jgi:hypothetical protein
MTRFRALREAPRREALPLLWDLFCREHLLLSPQTTQQWWRALQRARWSRPVELRSVFLCRAALGTGQGSMRHFVTTNIAPAVLIGVLEDLIHEQVLPPATARAIEQAVLNKTHKSGLWL